MEAVKSGFTLIPETKCRIYQVHLNYFKLSCVQFYCVDALFSLGAQRRL
jgi:hypothetical protein